jgi:6-pyruvoyltetrahydropterin/6-carboxytetrahydropterin synthase
VTYTVSKSYTFAASHQLSGLPEGHQCSRLHGHNYTVGLEMTAGALDDVGMVFDFGDMAPFRAYLDGSLDHRHLNDVIDGNPTAEILAGHLLATAVDLLGDRVAAVTVWETATCWASCRRA